MGFGSREEQGAGGNCMHDVHTSVSVWACCLSRDWREMTLAASPSRSGMVSATHCNPVSNAGRQGPDLCWDHEQRAHVR